MYVDMVELSSYGDRPLRPGDLATMATSINSIRDVAAAVRGRRLSLGLSQGELAARAHVSRQWISALEAGKSTVELRLVIRLLDTLALRLTLDDRDDGPGAPRSAVDLDALLEDYRAE